ncbi:hypothetical protein BLNAU_11039 [Blattamonas nauphoetae]|uniref:Serine-threonine/tyrosine-protein kinase catalytic domain-containing protein n=1 Tax=Blattamonas nauphoetae TaxID=2049346 RepID=A0ABQ9XSF6_9EUKA|nr:hypothetical protein BLNAU_11039 [Blattamonas nauphoetae]
MFGENERTSDSFRIQLNAQDRMAQAAKENMAWWLPLVIVLVCAAIFVIVILVILCRRRKNKTTKIPDQPTQEMVVEDKMEIEYDINSVPIGTSSDQIGLRTNQTWAEEKADGIDSLAANATQNTLVEVLRCGTDLEIRAVPKTETLFKRLHEDKLALRSRRVAEIAVARGLQHLSTARAQCEIFAKLTSHWILIGADEGVHLRMSEDTSASVAVPGPSGIVAGEEEKREQVVSNEGQRWQAPEQGKMGTEIDIHQASVFRLGLVLWEIETGLVPFGETDAVNAHRQLALGTLPPMEKVGCVEMQELIASCLALDGKDRPSLDSLVASLESIKPDSNDYPHTIVS